MKDSLEMLKLKSDLAGYIGTDQYHKLSIVPVNCTDGVKGFADLAQAYWLISDLTIVAHMKYKNVPFQLWEIKVAEDHTAALTMREDTGLPAKYTQKYEYTDFPVGSFKLYLIDGVLLLPSEY